MENLVLYRDVAELREKLSLLRNDPQLAARIADAGRLLAERQYSFQMIGQKIVEAMALPLRASTLSKGWFSWFR